MRAISIAGRREQLNDLEAAVRRVFPKVDLRKSETDLPADGDILDTKKLIQVIFALLPPYLLKALDQEGHSSSKAFSYSQKVQAV